jgi:hypothetical protein
MGLKGVKLDSVERYVLKHQKSENGTPEEGAAVWNLGTLTARQRAGIRDKAVRLIPGGENQEAVAELQPNTLAYETVKAILRQPGVEGLVDPDTGEQIKLTTTKKNLAGRDIEVANDAFMNHLEDAWIAEVSGYFWGEEDDLADEGKTSAE